MDKMTCIFVISIKRLAGRSLSMLLKIRILLLFVVFASAMPSIAQSTRDVDAPKPPPPQYQAYKKNKKTFKIFKKIFSRDKSEVEEFRERVTASYKQTAKERRKSDKPKFKDPTYFGHRKPPRKRPPGKQKFCKECGLKH
jgi:hypothetical protein